LKRYIDSFSSNEEPKPCKITLIDEAGVTIPGLQDNGSENEADSDDSYSIQLLGSKNVSFMGSTWVLKEVAATMQRLALSVEHIRNANHGSDGVE
jgi:hypothetical protein